MKKYLLALFATCLIFSSWKADALPLNLEARLLPSTEADLDAFIDHRVNIINGDYCEVVTDLSIKGPDDLILQRYYNNANYVTGKGAGSWRIFPQCWLTIGKDTKGKSCTISGVKYYWTYAFAGERAGSILTYSGWESKTVKDEGLQVWAFQDGRSISNTAHGEMSGRVSVQNNLLRYQTDTQEYTLTMGDGNKRFFEKVETLPSRFLGEELNPCLAEQIHEPEFYRLTLEVLPSGNKICYSYNDNGHLARVEMVNAAEKKTLSWIVFDYQEKENQLTLTTSDGRHASYTLDQSRITKANYSDRPEIEYSYNDQGKLTKVGSAGRITEVEYDTNMRVSSLKERDHAGERGSTTRFAYGNGYTEVSNAISQKTIYRYSKKQQLETVEYYDRANSKYRVDRKYWSPEREASFNLLAKTIEDGEGNTLSCRQFSYDSNGNVIEERLYGNLTGKSEDFLAMGKNGEVIFGEEDDCHVRKMEYSTDGFNLLVKMGDCKGNEIVFEYLPGTNRLSKKFIKDNKSYNKIKRRFFYFYDDDGVCIRTIEDDGSEENPNRISGWDVTERRITEVTPKENLPGVGLPLVVVEQASGFRDDFKVHQLKKQVNFFDSLGRLLKEKTYDADDLFRFSKERIYDAKGNLIEEIDPEGNQTFYQYDSSGNCVLKTLPHLNATYEFAYNSQGRIVKIHEVYGDTEYMLTNAYDLLGNKVSSTDRRGNRTDFEYDLKGFLSKVIYPAVRDHNGGFSRPETFYENDMFGNPLRTTDARGYVMLKRFNLRGDPISIDYPDGTFELFKYDSEGSLHRHLTRDGIVSVFEYDFLGRQVNKERSTASKNGPGSWIDNLFYRYNSYHLKSVKDKGTITCYDHDFAGRISTVFRPSCSYAEDDPDSRKEEYSYDALGRISEKKVFFDKGDEDYSIEYLKYDVADRLVEKRIEDAHHQVLRTTRYLYDNRGLLSKEQALLNGDYITVTQTSYNELGEPLCITDAEGKETTFQYGQMIDEAGQTVSKKTVIDPSGVKTEILFDVFDRVVSITKVAPSGELLAKQSLAYDSVGNKVLEENHVISAGRLVDKQKNMWIYGPMNRIDELHEAVNTEQERVTLYSYGKDGKLSSKLLPGMKTPIMFTYGKGGQLYKVCHREGEEHLHIANSYTHDSCGNIISANSFYGKVITRTYNAFNEVTCETIKDEGNEYSTHYEYDRKGRVTLVRLPDGSKLQYTYDALHGRSVSRISSSGSTLYTHEYLAYDEWGRLKEEKMPGFSGHRQKEWDLSNCLLSSISDYYTERVPIGGYDALGNLLKLNREGEFDLFDLSCSYDLLSQITSESAKEHHIYAYDSIGNRLEKNNQSYRYDSLNQLIKTQEDEYKYNLRGCPRKRVRNGSEWIFDSNVAGQLVQIQKDDNTCLDFSYGPFGRRLTSKHFDVSGKKKKRISLSRYLYMGEMEIGRIDENGKIYELRIPGLANEEPSNESVAIEVKGKVLTPLYDIRENVVALIDPQWREVVEYYAHSSFGEETIYDAYGDQLDESAYGNPWRYAGKRIDKETNLTFFGLRFYDPIIGRWISPDPTLFVDGPNLYAYAHNNPLHYFDRFGLSTENRNSEAFEDYFYGEVETHCFCERHRTCKRGGDLSYGAEAAAIAFLDWFEAPFGNKSRIFNLSDESQFQELEKGMIMFINGMNTSLEEALSHATYIANLAGGYNVHGVYNASHGPFTIFPAWDLVESVLNTICFATPPVRLLHQQWDAYFATANSTAPILLICHSQGAIHVRNALMSYPCELRDRIIVLAIAPAAYISQSLCRVERHYKSKWNRDIVPFCDPLGRMLHSKNVVALPPHKDASTFDHDFQSPTYKVELKYQIRRYVKTYGGTR